MLADGDEDRITEAAIAWAERYGGDTDERSKWLDDWSQRAGNKAGWQTLERVACTLIDGYADERNAREHAAIVFPPLSSEEIAAAEADIKAAKPSNVLTPKPYVWTPADQIKPREWVYGNHYIRRYVTATFAPGAVGKSAHALVEALDMVTRRGILRKKVQDPKPLRVWYWNGEDPQEELDRRLAAICLHHGISEADIDGRLFVNSGRDSPIIVATEDREGCQIQAPVVEALIAAIEACQIDVLILDPFVSVHRVNENDNNRIDMVAKQFAAIADQANISIELIHHTRKGNLDADKGVDDGRGAGALVAAARSVRVLNRMDKDTAEAVGIFENERRSYFRVDAGDKANLTPPAARAHWRHIANLPMNNGTDDRGMDFVGVVERWRVPTPAEAIEANFTPKHITALHRRLAEPDAANRRHVQAGEQWVGYLLADILGWDVQTNKALIGKMIAELVRSGVLAEATGQNAQRHPVRIVEPGSAVAA